MDPDQLITISDDSDSDDIDLEAQILSQMHTAEDEFKEYNTLYKDEFGIRLSQVVIEDDTMPTRRADQGDISFAKLMMRDLNENLEVLQTATKKMVQCGILKAEGSFIVSLGFKNRSADILKQAQGFIEKLIAEVYKLETHEATQHKLKLEIIDVSENESKLVFRVPETKDNDDHDLFMEELETCIETRHFFVYTHDVLFVDVDIHDFENNEYYIRQIIKNALEMEDTEKVLELKFTTVDEKNTDVVFSIPFFYKDQSDEINWIEEFQKNNNLKNIFMFELIIGFHYQYNWLSKAERKYMKETTRTLIKDILKMNDSDVVLMKFRKDEDGYLTLYFKMPKKYKEEGCNTNWYTHFEAHETIKNLIRITQSLIFVDINIDTLKKREKDIRDIFCDELGLETKQIYVNYESEKNDDGETEINMILDLPSYCEEKLNTIEWLEDILPTYESTKNLFSTTYPITIENVKYRKGKDYGLIKAYAHDISHVKTKDIFVRMEQNDQNLTIFIAIPETAANDVKEFPQLIGERLICSDLLFEQLK